MRNIKKIHKAEYRPMGDLITYSPLPTRALDMIDPFLFLNHHGPQKYPPNNNGLPFGPHPHRGMATVTFILHGDVAHQDSTGHKSVIKSGGIQWMTAGSGLLHAEVSSDEFKKEGGLVELLQLWVNLPAKQKMIEPNYVGLQKDEVPIFLEDEEKVKVNLVSGQWKDQKAALDTPTDVFLSTIEFAEGAKLYLNISKSRNIFFYVIKGTLRVNSITISALHLAEFENNSEKIEIEATEEAVLLLGHAEPYNEPVVARGPFVMNSMEEIDQAYDDFQNGRMGTWK